MISDLSVLDKDLNVGEYSAEAVVWMSHCVTLQSHLCGLSRSTHLHDLQFESSVHTKLVC